MLEFDNTIEGYIEEWTPKKRPIHCSNCANCRVGNDDYGMTAHCEAGHGTSKPLSLLIRLDRPRGWKDAAICPDFKSMD